MEFCGNFLKTHETKNHVTRGIPVYKTVSQIYLKFFVFQQSFDLSLAKKIMVDIYVQHINLKNFKNSI